VLAATCLSPAFEEFVSIGHTPAYWPLLALFAWMVVRERWPMAALVLGLLVGARTTMLAIVPVLLMVVWIRDRGRFVGVATVLVVAATLPFVPFAVWDASALRYALYGSYQQVMKGFVWTETTSVQHTIGLTGVLLSHHLQGSVEILQGVALAVTYLACWAAFRKGRPPIAWMGLALLVFSMTTLWPVSYLYFDVFLLLASAAVAETLFDKAAAARIGVFGWWTTIARLTAGTVVVTTWAMLPANATAPEPIALTPTPNGTSGLSVRRTTAAAFIEVEPSPSQPGAAASRMSVVLNDVPLGTVALLAGRDRISVPAPRAAWQIGLNKLDLVLDKPVLIDRVIMRPLK
jgi:hypothetical protein